MKPIAVESTTLATVAYDRELLQLEFLDRTVYPYSAVPAHIPAGLLRAASKGRYFNRFIRGRFTYTLERLLNSLS
jgi:KTSC domain-containing protein